MIAHLLVSQGVITEDQLVYAKRVQSKLVSHRSLVEVLKALNQLTNAQLNQALNKQSLDIRIGDLLVELGQIRQDDLDAALAAVRAGARCASRPSWTTAGGARRAAGGTARRRRRHAPEPSQPRRPAATRGRCSTACAE